VPKVLGGAGGQNLSFTEFSLPFPMLRFEEQSEERRSALDTAVFESQQAGYCSQGANPI